jgi:branched-chain amino acid transport system permease protein
MTAIKEAADGALAPVRTVLENRIAGPIIKGIVALALATVACNQIFDAQPSIIVDGIALGSLYGLIGAGVILIYRTNRIINFAAAGLGAVPAVAGVLLIVNKHVSWYLMFPASLLAGALLGALVDILIIRRFAKTPRLILTVVTIGVSQLLAFIAIFVPRWLKPKGGQGQFISEVPTPFLHFRFHIGKQNYSGDYIFAVILVTVLVAGLALFFRYTRIGIALRASAENADRASLLGIPVRRVGTVAWMLAGFFAAATIFTRSTLVGVPVDGTLGPIVLLYALAAAVIARMESVPVALGAGVIIGMFDQSSVSKTGKNSLAGAIMLVLILGALLLQRGKLSRAQDSGVSSFSHVKEFRPIPTELRRVREVVFARGALFAIVAFALLGAPFFLGDARLSRAAPLLAYAIVAISLVILTGWAGQISLGQFGIVGIGAVVAGGLAANHNIDFFAALFLGMIGGAFVAVLVGLPALRIQGLYLAVTTLAFAGAVSGYVLNPQYTFGKLLLPESGNRIERFMLWQRIDFSTDTTFKWFGPDFTLVADAKYYYFCLVFLCLALLAARAYRRNWAGRILIAVRDNQRAAPAYAINLAKNRLAAFAISGAFAAAAGVLLAYHQGQIDSSSYGIGPSIFIFTATVIGGLTSLPGAVFGTLLIGGIDTYGETYMEGLSLLVTGPGLVLVLMFLPGGLAEGMYQIRDSFLRWVAGRHDILVPSLIADKRVETGEDQQDVITEAEQHVEETESFDLLGGPTITCPVCKLVLALDDAPEHDHLRAADDQLVAVGASNGTEQAVAPETDGGGRRRLARAKEGRR